MLEKTRSNYAYKGPYIFEIAKIIAITVSQPHYFYCLLQPKATITYKLYKK